MQPFGSACWLLRQTTQREVGSAGHKLDSRLPLALPSAGYRCRPMLSKLAMTDGIAAMLVALAANQPPQPHITESIQLPEALVP